MSNSLAIATVTETLRQILDGVAGVAVGGAHATALAPDAPKEQMPSPGVNIFLYQITPNPAMRNADLPTRAADGTLLHRPRAALDLHYLLTFYGKDAQLEQQRILGAVTLALHANPVLTRDAILAAEQSTTYLKNADLDRQDQLVRVVPISFSLEELSKLWSFLFKIDYVLSVAYVASVVLIETSDTIVPALPVLTAKVQALPFVQPLISQIVDAQDPDALITPTSQIALIGTNLASPPTSPPDSSLQVMVGGVAQSPLTISPTRITSTLPSGLAAGAQTVQVVQELNLGVPPVPHPGTGYRSAVAAFVLHPVIQTMLAETNVGSPPGEGIAVTLNPVVRAGQRAVLQLLPVSQPTLSQLFDGGTLAADSGTVTFPVPGLASGTYFARVLIDGAESPLQLDPSGGPVGPTVTV